MVYVWYVYDVARLVSSVLLWQVKLHWLLRLSTM